MDFSLDRMHHALAALGLTRVSWPAAQIVGTNGKGSTSSFLAAVAQAHGLKTGLHTSPHFTTPRERIRINGVMLAPERWPSLASRVHEAAPTLTYFEFLTVLSLLAFEEEKVDFAVLETGLGGRYDATTAAHVRLVCFTPISFDHEKVLGPTITDIATDKAGAIRAHSDRPDADICPAFTGPQLPEAMRCLRSAALEAGVPLYEVAGCPLPFGLLDPASPEPFPPLGLAGPHQRDNARLALAAWQWASETFHWPLRREAVLEGLAKARLAGRFQRIPAQPGRKLPPLILDGAHNPHGLAALKAALDAQGIRPGAVIFSCLADKKREDMLPTVRAIAGDAPIFTPTIQDNERAASGEDLALALGPGAYPAQRLRLALDAAWEVFSRLAPVAAENSPVILCGSLYLLGEFFTLEPYWMEHE